MEDLNAKLQEILGSEEGMRQLQEMANALGLSGSLSDSNIQQPPPSPQSSDNSLPISPADLAKLGGLLQQTSTDSPAAGLLRALRPLLKESRQKKVDEAIKILRLLSLWPVLQQSGLLKGFLGSLDE